MELRLGNQGKNSKAAISSGDSQRSISASSMLQYLAIKLDKEALEGENFTMNISLIDTKEEFSVQIRDGVMLTYDGKVFEKADVEIECDRIALFLIQNPDKKKIEKAIEIEGDKEKFYKLADNMNSFENSSMNFNIIEP